MSLNIKVTYPNEIPNIETWYDPSSTSLQGLSAGTYVNFVQDLSGNNRHLIQDRTTANQPTLIYNNNDGRVGLYFEGSSQRWLFASGWTTSSVTQFCVFKNEKTFQTSSPFGVFCSSIGNSSARTDFQTMGFHININIHSIHTRNNGSVFKPAPSGITLNQTRVYYSQDTTTNNIAMINGVSGSISKFNDYRIGVCLGGNFIKPSNITFPSVQIGRGTIYEYISYDRLLTPNEIKKIERYLLLKWGVNGTI